MNQTVINDILPMLIPNIAKANNVTGVINVFEGMGGTSDWRNTFPSLTIYNEYFAIYKAKNNVSGPLTVH